MLRPVNLSQGSEAWHGWRDNGVGSSDVKIVMGESKVKSRWQLWAEKRGIKEQEDLSKNPHVRRGKFYEPRVREVMEKKLGCKLSDMCAEDVDHVHRKVSFDGVTPDNIPVEIKCPDTNMWNGLVTYKRESEVFLAYVDQLIYQIGMLEAEFGYLVFFHHKTSEVKMFKVMARPERFKQICDAIDDFCLNYLFAGKEPELDKTLDAYRPTDQEVEAHEKEVIELLEVMAEISKLNKKLEEANKKRDDVLQRVKRIACDYRSINLFGLKITVVRAKERFDYKAFVMDKLKGKDVAASDKKKYSYMPKMSFRLSHDKSVNWGERKTELAQKRMDQIQHYLQTHECEDDEELEYLF